MTGRGGVQGRTGGFGVADLTDQDHVRVVAEEVAQGVGKAITGALVDLGLSHGGHSVFHRILDGEHVALDQRLHAQGGVQGGALAGSGGAGEQNQPVGAGEQAREGRYVVAVEAQILELVQVAALGQQA